MNFVPTADQPTINEHGSGPLSPEASVLTRNGVGRGFRQGIPFGLGTMAFGAAFGILAGNSGISDIGALLMSIFIYSGTAQILGLELWNGQASMLAIWGGTVLVSIRYILLGMTMRDWFAGMPSIVTYPALFLTADQGWALTHAEMQRGCRDAGFFVGGNLALFVGWTSGTVAGTVAGSVIPDPSALGLDFAATAAFIGILAGMFRGRSDILPWIIAAGAALLTERMIGGHWYVIAGALAGSVTGVFGRIRNHGT